MNGTNPTTPLSMTDEDIANLSDEELMQLEEPMPVAAEEPTGEVDEVAGDAGGAAEPDPAGDADPAAEADPDGSEALGAPDEEDPADGADPTDAEDADEAAAAPADDKTDPAPPGSEKDPAKGEADSADPAKPEEAPAAEQAEPVDYEAAYKKIFAPFKANGKQVQLQSPDEVVRLMQMGANYTKKLQALQPNLRMVRMLEEHGMLSEEKINFMIDLDRKDPAAIAKYLKDSGVDPMDIDPDNSPEYKPGDYRVSDEDMRFQDALQEAISAPGGQEFIQEIDKGWDEPSKNALGKNPEILQVLTEHRSSGVYDRIASEVERRKMFGEFASTPFIQAYYEVGQTLQQQGALTPTAQPAPAPGGQPSVEVPGSQTTPKPAPRVVAQRTAPRKPAADSAQVRAAQPTRAAAQKVEADFNPLAMDDEEFEKNNELAMKL